MYIVIRHINGQIDSDPFIVYDDDIEKFIYGEYLIFSIFNRYVDVIENSIFNFLKEIDEKEWTK